MRVYGYVDEIRDLGGIKFFKLNTPYCEDYDRYSEVLLAKYVKEKNDSDFFPVNKFPFAVKPFCLMKIDETPEWARSVDLVQRH